MAGVATQMTIRDGMTSKLRKITTALSQNEPRPGSDRQPVGPGKPWREFRQASSAVSRASGQVDNFNRKQQQAQKEAKGVANAWGSVKKYIGSALAAISVQKIIDLADTMTTTRARIDLMNDGLQTTDELQSMIMASANRSRAAYQTTADAVSKMGIMAKDALRKQR